MVPRGRAAGQALRNLADPAVRREQHIRQEEGYLALQNVHDREQNDTSKLAV